MTFKKSEILYDVMNETHIKAQGKFARGDKSIVAYVLQASDDDSDINKLVRSLQNAMSSLKTHLSHVLVTDGDESSADNILMENGTEQDDIILKLNVSSRFNKAYTSTIINNAHRYIVNTCIADWFVARDSENANAKDYFALASNAINDVQASFVKLPPARPARG